MGVFRILSTSSLSVLLTSCAAATATPATPAAPATQATTGTAQTAGSAGADACNRPVYLVVWIENLNRERSAAYGRALRESRIVSRNGGEYLAVSPPGLILEGNWPADRGFVVERYPCRARFDAMWFSAEYQNVIKPLREGSGNYTVALFDSWPPAPPRASAPSSE